MSVKLRCSKCGVERFFRTAFTMFAVEGWRFGFSVAPNAPQLDYCPDCVRALESDRRRSLDDAEAREPLEPGARG